MPLRRPATAEHRETGRPGRITVLVWAVALSASLSFSGACATTPKGAAQRRIARDVLVGIALGSTAVLAIAAVEGRDAQVQIEREIATGTLTPDQYQDLDADGRYANAVARGSALFALGSLIMVGLLFTVDKLPGSPAPRNASNTVSAAPESDQPTPHASQP